MLASEAVLIYGFHPVREALRHRPHEVGRVLVSQGRRGARRDEIEESCRRHGIAFEAVSAARLSDLAGPGNNGFVARMKEGRQALERVADADLVVLVEDLQDPRNLGALMRVCEGAGVARLLIRDRGSAPLTPVVVKTSAGASEWLPVERITNTAQILEGFKKDGFWTYGAASKGAAPWDLDLSGKIVLCFGGEEKGLRPRTRKICDALVGLPMRGRVASLNLATAAAAVLYEAVRQRCLASRDSTG